MTDFKDGHECEKQPLVEEVSPQPFSRQPLTLRQRLTGHVFPCLLLMLSMTILFRKVFVCHHHYDPNKHLRPFEEQEWELAGNNTTKVALEAHIMSKCPDAKDCLQDMVVPAMAKVSDKVDFRLSYIGSVNSESDDVQCKHGPPECLGNIIELCVAKSYPEPIIYLGFTNCMTSQYQRIPDRELIEMCAMEHGIDFSTLNSCISEEGEGMRLLRDSVRHSQDVHVSTSCTVRVDEEVFCVRDGGQWKDCPGGSGYLDLVAKIDELYKKKNSS